MRWIKTCLDCGEEKNALTEFDRWSTICKVCRPQWERQRELIASLQARDRQLITLRNQHGFSDTELGRRHSTSAGATELVRRRIHVLRERGIQIDPEPGREAATAVPAEPARRRAVPHKGTRGKNLRQVAEVLA